MRLLLMTLTIFAVSEYSTSLSISNEARFKHLGPEGGNSPFLHRIGDWLRNMRNRVWNRVLGIESVTPPPSMELDISEFDVRQVMQQEKVPIDLSTLSFDPTSDWGFRIGNWYVVHKRVKVQNRFDEDDSREWPERESSGPMDEVTFRSSTTFDRDDTENEQPTETPSTVPAMDLPLPDTSTHSVTQFSTQLPFVTPTTKPDLSELATERSVPDDPAQTSEVDNELVHPNSVEVFM